MKINLGLIGLICFATLLSCSKGGSGSGTGATASSSEIINSTGASNSGTESVKVAPLSEPVSNTIISEKNLYLQTSDASVQIKTDVEAVASDAAIKTQTAAKGDELLSSSKSIIDCSTASAVETCLQ